MQIIEPEDWPAIRDALPDVTFLLHPLIPAGSTTFMHGPPGCGKSAFAWGAANAIMTGTPYLGLETSQANCLLISTDMNLYQYKLRWGHEAFKPAFPFVVLPKFDITSNKFRDTNIYAETQAYIKKRKILVAFFDALGGLHAGRSARDDETATLVDAALNAWLPGVAKVLLAHDRKMRQDEDEPDDEGFIGSQLWRANATSQLHIWRSGPHRSRLKHAKSQVSDLLTGHLELYIDLDGKAELWQEKRAQEVIEKTNVALRKAGGMANLTSKEACLVLMQAHGISERTARRWLSLARG